jgi:phosphatidylinositol alpha-1,6-mannosyltransferase
MLTQCFPSRLGGIESLVSNLAIGLGKLEKVIVFADRHDVFNDAVFDNQYKNEILIKRIGGIKFFRRRKKIKEMKSFIESKQVKLVLADTWKSLELGIDYLNKKKIPVICLAHGNELLSNNKNKKDRIQKILNKATSIVANSNFTKNLVKKIINPQINLTTIYPGGVDLSKINVEEIFGITGSPILLTLGRLEKRKGHLKILDTINELIPEFPNIQYIIAGSGPELNNLKTKVKENNLEKNITFVGQVNDCQKKFLFQKTQLMIMPTLDETQNRSIEGFGIAYIEAAFFSIPSVASNIGGTPEAVIDNVTGRIINNIDDLLTVTRELLLNQNKVKKLGQNAQKRALEEFQWDYILKQYLSLIHMITKTN